VLFWMYLKISAQQLRPALDSTGTGAAVEHIRFRHGGPAHWNRNDLPAIGYLKRDTPVYRGVMCRRSGYPGYVGTLDCSAGPEDSYTRKWAAANWGTPLEG